MDADAERESEFEPTTDRPNLTVLEGGLSDETQAPTARAEMTPDEITMARNVLMERGEKDLSQNDAFVYDFSRAYFMHSLPTPDKMDPYQGALAYAKKLHP